MFGIRTALLPLICLCLTCCGTYVPPLQEYGQSPEAGGQLVQAILENVTCELQDAVYDVIQRDRLDYKDRLQDRRQAEWLESWGAQILLNITIDGKRSIAR